ncbi:MAG: TatD family hydrolase [Oscillospiraceae bacterium]|nr:TatD family hydrolase [Oscillospiraceae bacterium]
MDKLSGIFDTHAHYDDERFDNDRDKVLSSMNDRGISYICNVSSDLKGCKNSLELADKYDFIYCATGVHPICIENLASDWVKKLSEYAKCNKVVAIGEIGLDYHYEGYSKSKQIDGFERQMDLAQSLDLPVIIHSREATNDTLDIIRNFPKVSGVVHCFSGSVQTAFTLLDLGWYIGFTGVVTFKNAKKTVEVAKEVPNERFVIETDCPYMAPEPWRGSRCDSTMLVSVANKIAEIKDMSASEVVNITRKNAFDLYRLNL